MAERNCGSEAAAAAAGECDAAHVQQRAAVFGRIRDKDGTPITPQEANKPF